MRWIGKLIGLIFVVVSLPSAEASARETRRAMGLALAQRMCSECHAIERKMATSPNLDAPKFSTIANTRGMTAKYLSAEIQRAHQTMPNLNLKANELRNIITYILSLK
jgi:mono/diheme cytochrome c family protein